MLFYILRKNHTSVNVSGHIMYTLQVSLLHLQDSHCDQNIPNSCSGGPQTDEMLHKLLSTNVPRKP